MELIVICTTAAVTDIALQTSVQTHNFTQNWTEDAYTMWVTQAQIDEDIQDEIQELKTAIKWVGDQLIYVQKQVILKCDWNSTQFCVQSVQFSRSVMSDSLRPHESQHARPPCPSPTPRIYSNSCPSSR